MWEFDSIVPIVKMFVDLRGEMLKRNLTSLFQENYYNLKESNLGNAVLERFY